MEVNYGIRLQNLLQSGGSLAHSKGPWKKHKYVRKEGSGASAKYYYKVDFLPFGGVDVTDKDYHKEGETNSSGGKSFKKYTSVELPDGSVEVSDDGFTEEEREEIINEWYAEKKKHSKKNGRWNSK